MLVAVTDPVNILALTDRKCICKVKMRKIKWKKRKNYRLTVKGRQFS